MLLCLVLLGGCGSNRNSYDWSSGGDDSIYAQAKSGKKGKKGNKGKKVKKVKEIKKENKVNGTRAVKAIPAGAAHDVVEAAMAWMGTPYSYGGSTRGGTDCSGLTCMAFERGASIKLPRSSSEQADFCKRIKRSDLQPADLVFFTNRVGGSRINHVAIYIGDNRIIHATTSLGVTISSLDEPYWDTHLHSCGRIL